MLLRNQSQSKRSGVGIDAAVRASRSNRAMASPSVSLSERTSGRIVLMPPGESRDSRRVPDKPGHRPAAQTLCQSISRVQQSCARRVVLVFA